MDDQVEFSPIEIIDSVFKNHLVIIMEQTSHSMWVNSVALRYAGITLDTPDPEGGKIMKDPETGQLLGILVDNAGDIVMDQAWNNLENKISQRYDGLLNDLNEAAKNGITPVGDGRMYWKRGGNDVWKAVKSDGVLTARISWRPWIYPNLKPDDQLKFLKRIQSVVKTKLLITDQVKMYSDGIIINSKEKVLVPYSFTYFLESPYGIHHIPPFEMESWLIALDKMVLGLIYMGLVMAL